MITAVLLKIVKSVVVKVATEKFLYAVAEAGTDMLVDSTKTKFDDELRDRVKGILKEKREVK